jgi:hypothetical protein
VTTDFLRRLEEAKQRKSEQGRPIPIGVPEPDKRIEGIVGLGGAAVRPTNKALNLSNDERIRLFDETSPEELIRRGYAEEIAPAPLSQSLGENIGDISTTLMQNPMEVLWSGTMGAIGAGMEAVTGVENQVQKRYRELMEAGGMSSSEASRQAWRDLEWGSIELDVTPWGDEGRFNTLNLGFKGLFEAVVDPLNIGALPGLTGAAKGLGKGGLRQLTRQLDDPVKRASMQEMVDAGRGAELGLTTGFPRFMEPAPLPKDTWQPSWDYFGPSKGKQPSTNQNADPGNVFERWAIGAGIQPQQAHTSRLVFEASANAWANQEKGRTTGQFWEKFEGIIKVKTVEGELFQVESEPLKNFTFKSGGIIEDPSFPMSSDPTQFAQTLRNAHVSDKELVWSGLQDLIDTRQKILKSEALDVLQKFDSQLVEHRLTGKSVFWDAQNYVSPGAHESYSELVITSRDSRFQNQAARMEQGPWDEENEFFQLQHYGENARDMVMSISRVPDVLDGVIGYARISERRWQDKSGKWIRALFIDEIQSDEEMWQRSLNQLMRPDDEVRRNAGTLKIVDDTPGAAPGAKRNLTTDEIEAKVFEHSSKVQRVQEYRAKVGLPELTTDMIRALPSPSAVDNWDGIVLQRVVRMAAEQDYDRVIWNQGDVLADRYIRDGTAAEGMRNFYDVRVVDKLNKLTRRLGGKTPTYKAKLTTEMEDVLRLDKVFDPQSTSINSGPLVTKDGLWKIADALSDFSVDPDDVIRAADLHEVLAPVRGEPDVVLTKVEARHIEHILHDVLEVQLESRHQGQGLQLPGFIFDGDPLVEISKLVDDPLFRKVFRLKPEPQHHTTQSGLVAVQELNVHVLELGPELRKSVEENPGFYLQQSTKKGVAAKGGVSFNEFNAGLIHAAESFDVSTLIHEWGHIYRRNFLEGDNLRIAADWAGAESTTKWSREAEEKFSRGLERYFRDGYAATPELQGLFDNIKAWMTDIYRTIRKAGPLDVKMTPEMRGVFDRMFGGVPDRRVVVRNTDLIERLIPGHGTKWFKKGGIRRTADGQMFQDVAEPVIGTRTSREVLKSAGKRLFHVTTNESEVRKSGVLRAGAGQEGGGLGGGEIEGVSFFTDFEDAQRSRLELMRAGVVARSSSRDVMPTIRRFADDDVLAGDVQRSDMESAVRYAEERYEAKLASSTKDEAALDAFRAYLQKRRGLGTEDPILKGTPDSYKSVTPENVGVIEVAPDNLPDDVALFQASDEFLNETRALGDVPLATAKFGGDGGGLKPPGYDTMGIFPTPEAAGHNYISDIPGFRSTMDTVTTLSDGALKSIMSRRALRWINPSLLKGSPVGRALTTYDRMGIAADHVTESALTVSLDIHAKRWKATLGHVIPIDRDGYYGNTGKQWGDVFSEPQKYDLTLEQRRYIIDYQRVIEEMNELLLDYGIDRPKLNKDGWYYIPRRALSKDDVELLKRGNPRLGRVYDTMSEGFENGIRYETDPRAVLQAHVRTAYQEIITKQMSEYLEPFAVNINELIPQRLKDAKALAHQRSLAARATVQRAKDAARGEELITRVGTKMAGAQEEAGLAPKFIKQQEKLRKQRASIRQKLEEDIVAAQKDYATARENFKEVSKEHRTALVVAKNRSEVPGRLFGENQPNRIQVKLWRNKYFKTEDVVALEAGIDHLRGNVPSNFAYQSLSKLGNTIRFMASYADFAAPFIHGQALFFRNPAIWARATVNHYYAFADPTVRSAFIEKHYDTIQTMGRYGIDVGDVEMYSAARQGLGPAIGAPVERFVPGGAAIRGAGRAVAGQFVGRFQASYNNFLTVARANMWEALAPKFVGKEHELAAHIRNLTGALDSKALGAGPNQRSVEGLMLAFSPRLLRSTIALVQDVFLARGQQRKEAIYVLSRWAMGVHATVILSGVVMGKDHEEIVESMNPLNGRKYLAHFIGGDWIGAPGQLRAMIQFMGSIVSTLGPGGRPVEDLWATNMSDNPFVQAYMSRGAPGLNILGATAEAGGALMGADVDVLPFEDIDSLPDLGLHLATSALPMAVQGLVEGLNVGSYAGEVVGARASYNPRDRSAYELFGRSFVRLEEDYLRDLATEHAGEGTEFRPAEEERRKQLESVANLVAQGELSLADIRREYFELEADAARDRSREFAGVRLTPPDVEAKDPLKRAYAQYAAVFAEGSPAYREGRLISSLVDPEISRLHGSWTDEQRAFVDRNSNTRPLPRPVYEILTGSTLKRIQRSHDARIEDLLRRNRADLIPLLEQLFFYNIEGTPEDRVSRGEALRAKIVAYQ